MKFSLSVDILFAFPLCKLIFPIVFSLLYHGFVITIKVWSDLRNSNVDSKDWWIETNDYAYDWVFTVPDWVIKENDLRLQLCAGENGKTAGIGLDFYGITVEELN